jgi:hypothetical protein
MRIFSRTSWGLFFALATLVLAPPALGQVVPGSSNPYLAGMPNGSTCCSGDSAPTNSPVLATGVTLTPGASLTFTVTGSVDNSGFTPTLTPDGGGAVSTPANNGISGATWPINALVGVFLDASQPDLSAAPTDLNFATTSFTTLSPLLKQAFFIGDGRTGTGSGTVQTFVVPAGATRLFLGTSDGFGWFNNTGSFTVTGGAGAGATPTPTVAAPTATPTVPAPTATATVSAANVPTLSFPMLAVLALALGGAAIFLMRRA